MCHSFWLLLALQYLSQTKSLPELQEKMSTPIRYREEQLEHRGAMVILEYQKTLSVGEPLSRLRLNVDDPNYVTSRITEWLQKIRQFTERDQEFCQFIANEAQFLKAINLSKVVNNADELVLSLYREALHSFVMECVVYRYDSHDATFLHVGQNSE